MNWQRRLTSLLGVLFLVAATLSHAQDAPKGKTELKDLKNDKTERKDKTEPKEAKAPNFYPLAVGNQWHYKVTVGENSVSAVSTITRMETIEVVDEKKETVKVSVARLEATIDRGDPKKDKEVVATEHLRQTDKGIFRYRNNGQDIAPPICLLKYSASNTASKWDGELTVGTDKGKYSCVATEESIEVAAGKFKALKVAIKIESKGKVVDTTYWFVADVGFVRQTVDAEGLSINMELERFVKKGTKK